MTTATENITIRKAQHVDAGLLSTVGAKTFYDTFAPFNTPANMTLYMEKNFNGQQIENEIAEPGSCFFLAFDGPMPAGYARVRPGEALPELAGRRALEIERIYAAKEYHGKAVGKLLLKTCLDHAQATGVETVWLGVWEHNPRAIAFYRKWGFEKFGEHIFTVGSDKQTDWLMRKDLL